MRTPTPAVLSSAHTRLSQVFSASMARGAYDVQTVVSRLPGSDDFMASVIFCGTAFEARQEAYLLREAASKFGFKLQGGVQDLMGATAQVEIWPKDGHLLTFTWNRKTVPTSPMRPVDGAVV